MWQSLLDILKRLISYTEKLEKIEATLKEHGQYIKELGANQTRMYYEAQLQRERAARERERLQAAVEREVILLRQENQQLRERLERLERAQLPPAPPKQDPDPDEEEAAAVLAAVRL
jgi:hypothetical protein